MNYKETGNIIPVTETELETYIKNMLYEHDQIEKITPNNKNNKLNPYIDQLIYKTKNNKIIQIPVDLQKKIINKWINKQYGNDLQGYDNSIIPTNVDYTNNDLGFLNNDNKFQSSVRPINNFDYIINENQKLDNLLNERNIGELNNNLINNCANNSCSFTQSNDLLNTQQDTKKINTQMNHSGNINNEYIINKTKNDNPPIILPTKYPVNKITQPQIIEKVIIKSNNNNFYYMLSGILILSGIIYLYKNKK